MEKPKISVIVTSHNYFTYLRECLVSIRAQTFKNFELIVVDDGSTDQSQEWLFEANVNKLILLRENHGVCYASNLGVSVAEADICVFVNADDTIEPTFLWRCFEALQSGPEDLAFVYTDFRHFGTKHFPNRTEPVNEVMKVSDWDLERLKDHNYILCSAMFKKSAFVEVGGFKRQDGMEDYDLWLRMGLAGFKGERVPFALYNYRAHEKNRSKELDTLALMRQIQKAAIGQTVVKQVEPDNGQKARGFAPLPLLDLRRDFIAKCMPEPYAISDVATLWLESFCQSKPNATALSLGLGFETAILVRSGLHTYVHDWNHPFWAPVHDFILHNCGHFTYAPHAMGLYDLITVNNGDANSQARMTAIVETAPSMLAKGGTILIHDAHFELVQKALDYLGNHGWIVSPVGETIDGYNRCWYTATRKV
jgi:glycosyltransferase involved in cell wall biosynthesis